MPEKIRASSPAHLLALLPHLLGYTPRESLLLVPLSKGTTCGVLRIDLPAPDDVEQVATTAVGHVCRLPEADALIAAVYTDSPLRDGAGVAYDALALAVSDRAEACGLRVVDELCVGADGWTPYPSGELRPLSEITRADPYPDRPVARAQNDGVDVIRADAADRAPIARHLRTLAQLPHDAFQRHAGGDRAMTSDEALDAELAAFDADPRGFFDGAAESSDEASAARAAVWMWALHSPALRDVVFTQWTGGAEEASRACAWQRRWRAGEADEPDFPVRLAGEGSRPDSERLRAARTFVRALASRAPDTHLGVCLAVCGWLSWAVGNATHAAEYAARAIDVDPSCTLARLIAALTDEGLLPGWAYDPQGTTESPAREHSSGAAAW
ncbi:DUF4192 family protein [Microbacterium suaedae]|uniref:DUF4192 family protein n=1 Tax=Microbacterium suaedae TaxID=2067813 RepID=UPI000DA117E1|nr:DUF4192 family protein [Microbacterium suaedae]